MQLGIMQGRLSAGETGALQEFPRSEWEEEFPRAAAAGIASIEWLYDVHGEDVNPLATDSGVERIGELARLHGVAVTSLCAHYLVERPDELLGRLDWLGGRCRVAGIARIVLPFIEGAEEKIGELRPLQGVELLVESSLEPGPLRDLADRLGVGVNYDSGSSASLGRDSQAEVEALGGRIRAVHLKDRSPAGENVALGEGIVDFAGLFEALERIGYTGGFVLETPRPLRGDEVAWGRRSVEFVSTIVGR